ncbi:endoglucanase 6-like [Salvia miltiorrhiza]|uniref:endoglucanase 6-like n=1 Tax=Salvia miltiorrhiza TaxID=226208 RepID=UPI0025AB643C|nr:endoglucanase 6-like [Salvia miltiorrhiza]
MAALFVLVIFLLSPAAMAGHDYGEALTKSILFFEAQRSGYLPTDQRVQWRGDSGLGDGKISGVDLVGGYYDAGDNVKFGLPMAFTVTMMSWSIIEYGGQINAGGELQNAVDAVKWGTDYFIKAHPQPYVLYGEVGDGNTDHYCWQRPEDMSTSRAAYKIDADHPGSDLAAETAAAMAAASIVFRPYNSSYSAELLQHAYQLFEFADKYRGKYDSSITVAQKYYRSVSGYTDELLWAAAWLYKATNKEYYLDYLGYNGEALGGTGWAMTEFGWDVKYAGVQTLVAKFLMAGKGGKHKAIFERYKEKAEFFMCSCNSQRTPGGLIFRQRWNNMQFVTTASFLTTVYSDYLTSAATSLTCANGPVSPSQLLALAKSQVDYILGDNPRATSYMVGYGKNYPQQVHHRASSIVSHKVDPSFVSCRGGYASWFSRNASDPNTLTGAVVGGPDAYDNFADHRDNYEQTEPATYNTAPLLGVLARLHAGYNHLLSVELPETANRGQDSSSLIFVEQKVTSSWNEEGKSFNRYSVMVSNKSSKKLKNLKLRIWNLHGPLWGLTKSGDDYLFPEWMESLGAGKSIEFVYIQSASRANVLVSSYTLV